MMAGKEREEEEAEGKSIEAKCTSKSHKRDRWEDEGGQDSLMAQAARRKFLEGSNNRLYDR